jgi:hypothetical protein
MRLSLGLMLILSIFASCKEYVDAPLSPSEQKRVNTAQLAAKPTPKTLLNIDVEDQIRLIGVDTSAKEVKAGDRVIITLYLEALSAQMEDNHIFLHFQCRGRPAFQNLDGKSITQRLHPLRNFQKGDVIADRIDFRVHKGCKSGPATLYWGLFRGADRLKFNNAKKGQVSHDGRLKAIRIALKAAAALTLRSHPSSSPISVDGSLNERAWSTSRPIQLSRIGGTDKAHQNTQIKAVYDDTSLYLGIVAKDSDIWSTFKKRDSNTWEQEVVEVFIDALGTKRDYLELQVTPANVVFDAKFAHHRSDLAEAKAWQMKGLTTAVKVEGTLNKRDDTDTQYTIEMKIPIDAVPGGRTGLKRGQWRINFFRFDQLKTKRQQASGWSPPPVPDFHHLDSFGQLQFIPRPATSN